MPMVYNASEACALAIDIEKNGREFYRAAAQNTALTAASTLFKELADWEENHIAVFTQLLEDYQAKANEPPPYDPDDVIGVYLKAAADTHIFIKSNNIGNLAAACKTPQEAILLALTFEKDSVVFYSTLKKAVPESLGATTVQKMIDEEISHISYLSDALKKIRETSK